MRTLFEEPDRLRKLQPAQHCVKSVLLRWFQEVQKAVARTGG